MASVEARDAKMIKEVRDSIQQYATATLRAKYLRYQVHTITPQSIIKFNESKGSVNPDEFAKQIVQCSDQIRQTLLEQPSGLELEMCALGYKTCTNNMLTLVRLVDEELEKSGPIRRLRLKKVLRGAAESLSKTHEAFPVGTLRVLHQKK